MYALLLSLLFFLTFLWSISDLLLLIAGLGTPIRRGLGGISLLKWSPSGDYFFSAKLYCKLPYTVKFDLHVTFEDTHYVINKEPFKVAAFLMQ